MGLRDYVFLGPGFFLSEQVLATSSSFVMSSGFTSSSSSSFSSSFYRRRLFSRRALCRSPLGQGDLDCPLGLVNTKLVEDFNKLQQDHECRDTNKQEISPTLSWRAGSQHSVLASYDREEISTSSLTNMPRNFIDNQFYLRRVTKDTTPEYRELEHKLKKVTETATWYTCAPESQQHYSSHAF